MIKTTKRFTFQKGFHDFLVIPTFCPFLTPVSREPLFCVLLLQISFNFPRVLYKWNHVYSLCGFFHHYLYFTFIFFHVVSSRQCRIGIISSLNIQQTSPMKPFGPGLFFVGKFLMTNSLSLIDTGILSISNPSSELFLIYVLQEIVLFHLSY